MISRRRTKGKQRGQTLVLFALLMSLVLIPAVGLVVDGGYALAQQRASQNASDFAALAGARIVAEWVAGNTTDGTDGNVQSAISQSVAVNKGDALVFGAPSGPRYVNSAGQFACVNGSDQPQTCNPGNQASSYVGSGTIPAGAAGVMVGSTRTWDPFFIGALVGTWKASSTATAKGGYAAAGPGTGVFPAGIAEAFFNGRQPCGGPATTNVSGPGACDPQHMTPGVLNVPGGFGWLKFGCSGYGLGQDPPANTGGCSNSKPFLQTEIGPPSNSFGCCTQVGLPGSNDWIGNLPGNKVSADCSYYIDNKITVTIPVWDNAYGNGQNAYYHIVGFTGFQITACDGGKDIEGVWRQPFWLGPTTTTPGFAGAPLAVQLVR